MAVTPDELRAWAVEVMKIPELSKTSDLSFICRGQMNEIWRYMIDNVKDLETAAAVHQNLQINNANSKCLSNLVPSGDVNVILILVSLQDRLE